MRRVLQLRALRTRAGGRLMSRTEEHVLELIERVKAKPSRFRDAQITMAHGAGGKATQTLIEGLLVPTFDSDPLRELADAATRRGRRPRPGDDDGQLRRQADPLPGRLDRRAGRERHGERPGDGGRTAAGADAVARARGRARRGRAAGRGRGDRRCGEGGPRDDRRRRHQGRRARSLRLDVRHDHGDRAH